MVTGLRVSSGRVAYSTPGWQGSRGMGGGVCLEQAVTLRKSKKLMSQMVPKADMIWWRFWIPEWQVCAMKGHSNYPVRELNRGEATGRSHTAAIEILLISFFQRQFCVRSGLPLTAGAAAKMARIETRTISGSQTLGPSDHSEQLHLHISDFRLILTF